ncbi:hypothetical protein SAMN06297358_1229 [Pedobacter xixiisoli]|uniref:Uncharacterized protein n=2 Tax=Pedobacter xixiisoli TaxID=1476464 RepID=A0A285ZVU5_9SPHI|nr:hypothetical protein SAMN06297358_1229 [Pedobacter xixiisoli]
MLFLASIIFTSCKKGGDGESEEVVTEKELRTKVPTVAPQTLYLILSAGTSVELVKRGDAFISTNYVPLEVEKSYSFNTKADGSGTSYIIKDPLSAYDYANDDKVIWDDPLLEVVQGKGKFSVARSQAYQLSVNFGVAQLTWQYHNIKLFHYTDWATRTEVLLSYKHPLTFERTLALPANNYLKFYSVNPDWLEWGGTEENNLTGNLTGTGGKDIIAVKDAGNYKVSITLNGDLKAGTYAFTKQ